MAKQNNYWMSKHTRPISQRQGDIWKAYLDSEHEPPPIQSEKRLLYYWLFEAIRDAYNKYGNTEAKEEALEWIHSDLDHLGSFTWTCHWLDLDVIDFRSILEDRGEQIAHAWRYTALSRFWATQRTKRKKDEEGKTIRRKTAFGEKYYKGKGRPNRKPRGS